MEAALELEDDVFFKDLSRQISLLIMDDDDDDDSLAHCPSVNLQGFNPALIRPAAQASFLNYEHQPSSKRESKGTGVFIPRSSNPRRKNAKQGRTFTGSGTFKSQRPSDHNSRGLTIPHYSNNINPSHDHYSFNLRRF
ncbi:hypothetical protein Sango_0575900 [Sesamum angolense]|uniref:Uncharacterized protein n=1 Tax=Sesamum angolense TaxID=2727404 RepID=A0AAE2C1L4_9LAMI|nr:hypothetical protein Sango_0575900 [Sesamum angolense]